MGGDFSSDSDSSSESSREGETSLASSDQEAVVEADGGDCLRAFYANKTRIDSKATTLKLRESSIDFYFGTILKDGEMSKKGKESLGDKYFLEPALYAKLQPPHLNDTKLSSLVQGDSRDSGESRLANIHDRVRDAAKVTLATLEHLAVSRSDPEEIEIIRHREEQADAQVSSEKTKDMVIDLLTVIGQADIALTQAREAALHSKLDQGFVARLKMLNKEKGSDSSRFKANCLFHEKLDTIVTRRAKEARLSKVLASTGQRYATSGGNRWSKMDRSRARLRNEKEEGDPQSGSRRRSRSRSGSREKPRTKAKASGFSGQKTSKKDSASRK